MNKEEQIKDGCGIWSSYSPSSKCVKDNLCYDCRECLGFFLEGKEEAKKEFIEDEIKFLKEVKEQDVGEECELINEKLKELKQQLSSTEGEKE